MQRQQECKRERGGGGGGRGEGKVPLSRNPPFFLLLLNAHGPQTREVAGGGKIQLEAEEEKTIYAGGRESFFMHTGLKGPTPDLPVKEKGYFWVLLYGHPRSTYPKERV